MTSLLWRFLLCLLLPLLITSEGAAIAAENEVVSGLTPTELFRVAADMEAADRLDDAAALYDALAHDPEVTMRSEARFRHGKMLAAQGKYAHAATLYRAILDEQPDAQPARLELANALARMGNLAGARRMLRQAQAGGLPEDIARVVDQYAAALRSLKPISVSLELALAPTTNINRATTATTLDTILAPFQLSDDARAKSGVGIKVGGQVTGRIPLADNVGLLGRISGQASLYRDASFNDVSGSAQSGLDIQAASNLRLQPLVGRNWRWYGGNLYATTDIGSINILKSVSRDAQIEANVGLGWAKYLTNDLQSGPIYNASLAYERAFSARGGGTLTATVDRQNARDPGYATTSGGVHLLVWREIGRTSFYVSAGLNRLVADDRLFLFPDKRKEWQFRTTVGGVMRALAISRFAPLARVTYERNQSTVGIYDYRRVGVELGLSTAF